MIRALAKQEPRECAMKKFGSLMLLALGAAAFVAGKTHAGAADGSWYIAPQVNAIWLDDGRAADDDAGATLAFGRTLSPNWDLEFLFYWSEHDMTGSSSLDLYGFGLQAKRVFYREGRVNPFVNFGLGRTTADIKPGGEDDDLSALFGVGILVDLDTPRDGSAMQLRADLGARRGLSSSSNAVQDPVDYVAGIGFQYSWGGTVVRQPVDSDGDGVTDDYDKCPNTPAGTPVDGSGCPLPRDDDGDGVVNELDKCPGTPAGAKVDAAGCEINNDLDGDGVLNEQDQCPDTPKGDRVDAVGCTLKAEIRLEGVVFETGKATLLPASIPTLESAVATLKRYPDLRIEVAGHTDSRGAEAYNQDLSNRRANAVADYLRNAGVTNSITARGYGESEPIASNDTDEGRQQNRRVVLRVLD
jgi:OOP family OmpA-OmpF porin